MSQIKGADTSAQNTTFTVDTVTVPNIGPYTYETIEDNSKVCELKDSRESARLSTTIHLINAVVTPNLRILLASVLGAVDASIPNKDQNKAVKGIVRRAFDEAYLDIIVKTHPDCSFGQTSDEYALTPATNKAEAFSSALQKL
jgi:methionine synthase II (cobalamin-independent)